MLSYDTYALLNDAKLKKLNKLARLEYLSDKSQEYQKYIATLLPPIDINLAPAALEEQMGANADVFSKVKRPTIWRYSTGILSLSMPRNSNGCFMRVRVEGNGEIPMICFTGTQDNKNWVSNFDTFTVPASYINSQGKGLVHKGFYNSYRVARSLTRDWCSKNVRDKNETILITGHSLGSAAAQACAYDLTLLGYSVACITLAPPHLGNYAFADHFNQIVPYSMHYRLNGDIVPTLPPEPLFRHVKNQYAFEVSQNAFFHCPWKVSIKSNMCTNIKPQTFASQSALQTAGRITGIGPTVNMSKHALLATGDGIQTVAAGGKPTCINLHNPQNIGDGIIRNLTICSPPV